MEVFGRGVFGRGVFGIMTGAGGAAARRCMRAAKSWPMRCICAQKARPPGRKRQNQEGPAMAAMSAHTASARRTAGCGSPGGSSGDVGAVFMTTILE